MKQFCRRLISLLLTAVIVIPQTIPAFAAANEKHEDSEIQDNTIIPADIFLEHEVQIDLNESIELEFNKDSIKNIDKVLWESSDDEIISVENGIITANKLGSAKVYINIYSEDRVFTDSCFVISDDEIKLFNASLSGSNLYNDYISLVAANERFSLGTKKGNPDSTSDDNRRLLYGWDGAGTSYATIVVDGAAQRYSTAAVFDTEKQTVSGTMDINNVTVNRKLSIVKSTVSGREDIVEFTYEAINNDTSSHSVGGRIAFDTMLGSNDSCPFRIPGVGAVTTQTELTGENIPQYWQSFDNLSSPTVIAQGTLYRNVLQRPDKVQFGNYGILLGNIWEATQNIGSSNGDSAVAMTWYPTVLAPGESRTFTTYYGISEMTKEDTSKISISATADTEAAINEEKTAYNPITVTAYLKNTGEETENNVSVSLNLPQTIKLADEYAKDVSCASMQPQEEKQVSWMIYPEASDEETDYSYSISVSSDEGDAVSVTKSIHVPLLDLVAPDAPQSLNAVSLGSRSAVLKWDDAYDKNGIAAYKLCKEDEEVYSGPDTVYRLTGLEKETQYEYSVYAVDSYGNESEKSTVSFTTVQPQIEEFTVDDKDGMLGGSEPALLKASARDRNNLPGSGMRFYFTQDQSSWNLIKEDNDAKKDYSAVWDFRNLASGNYFLKAELTDIDGEKDERIIHTTLDTLAPDKINNFVATPGEEQVLLSWEMGNEIDIEKYVIYISEDGVNYRVCKEIYDRKTTYYTDQNVVPGKQYTYKITAVDKMSNESEASEPAAATPLADTVPPQIMTISPSNGSVLTGDAVINVSASDNISVKSVELQYSADNGKTFKSMAAGSQSANASFTVKTKDFADGMIQVRAIAADKAGNVSDGLPVYTYIIDNTGPAKITGLKSVTNTYTSVTLEWDSIEDADYAYCTVEQNENGSWKQCAKATNVLGANIVNLTPNTEYLFRVAAYDKYGNRGVASDEISVMTDADTDAPVITAIYPRPGSYSKSIPLQITVRDSYKVKSLDIEISADSKAWSKETSIDLDTPVSAKTFSYTLDLSDKAEGSLYVRGVAKDCFGNISDTSEHAPYVQYNVDKTAPEAPKDVKLESYGGYLELKWTQGTEADLKGYDIYRSLSLNGEYTKIASGVQKINYIDTNTVLGKVYYYKLCAVDTAGNVGAYSDTVYGEMLADTEAPVIKSWNYVNGSVLKKSNTVNILAVDNNKLDSITLEYKTSESKWEVFDTKKSDENSSIFKFDMSGLADGKYSFRAKVKDASGNESDYSDEYTYTFDSAAPKINSAVLTPGKGSITISWNSDNEEDLSGFYVYRKTGNYYDKIASFSNSHKETYSFTDTNVKYGNEYTYKIEAFDVIGNKETYISDSVMPLYVYEEPKPDTTAPNIICSIQSTMQQGVEEYFDATHSTDDTAIASYLWEFGDGAVSTKAKSVHAYSATGVYTVRLTVTDSSGNANTVTKNVTVVEKKTAGRLKVIVVDDNGSRVSGAGVFYKLGKDDMMSYSTNSNGEVMITDYSGSYDIGVYADEYLPAKQTVTIVNNSENTVTIRIIKKTIVVGELTYKRMNFEEIVAAGIDPYSPENQYVYKYEINLTYGTTSYKGTAIKSQGTSDVQPVEITDWHQTSGGTSDTTLKGGYVWIIDDDKNSEDYNNTYKSSSRQIVAVLEIPGETSWLKEFFDVQLHIHNQAEKEFVIDDCVAELNYPEDGLTLMTNIADKYSEEKNVHIGSIAGQEDKYINWILRGEKQGEYDISAKFKGTLRDFNQEINADFKCSEPIKVYGSEGISMDIEAEDTIDDGYLYFNTIFKNQSGREVSLMNMSIDGIQPYDEMFSEINADGYAEYNVDDVNELISSGRTVVQNNQAFRKRYKVSFKEFATYINPRIDWDSDLYAIGSYLTEYFVKNKGDLQIPTRIINLNVSKEITGVYQSQGLQNDTGALKAQYSEGYFRNPSTKYNHSMAKSSLALCVAGMNSSVNELKYDDVKDKNIKYWHFNDNGSKELLNSPEAIERAANSAKNICNLYNEMGYKDENISLYDYDRDVNGKVTDRAAFSIANKTIISEGKEKNLINVVVRSGGYGNEWGSNFRVANPDRNWIYMEPYHYGFNECQKYVTKCVREYIEENNIPTENMKIWITGFSRGAVTANMAAANLNKIYGQEHIYAYTFATPQGIKTYADDLSEHKNIFNIVNPADLVPRVALSNPGWDYSRYGVTMYLPSKLSNLKFGEMYDNMLNIETELRKQAYADKEYSRNEDKYFYDNENQEKSQILLLSTLWTAIPTDKQYHIIQPYAVPLIVSALGSKDNAEWDQTAAVRAMRETLINKYIDYINYIINLDEISSAEEAIEFLTKTAGIINALDTLQLSKNDMQFLGELTELSAILIRSVYGIVNYSGLVQALAEITATGGLSSAVSVAKSISRINNMINAVKYAAKGIGANHMPELYAAWLNSDTAENLFTDDAYKIIRLIYAAKTEKEILIPFSEDSASENNADAEENEYVDIYVYTNDGTQVGSIVNGEVTENGAVITLTDSEAYIYLPSGEDYRVEMSSAQKIEQSYSVSEYNNYSLVRSVSHNDCNLGADEKGIIEISDKNTQYNMTDENGASVEGDTVTDISGDEIEYFEISVKETVGGTVLGTGKKIKGEKVELTAAAYVGYEFDGWYDQNDNLISDSTTYRFIADKDTELSVKFKAQENVIGFSADEQAQGNAPAEITALTGQKINLPENTFTKPGYKFAGWLAEMEFDKVFLPENAEFTVKGNVEFKAVWVGIDMLDGAAVRTVSPTGLRFYSQIETESFEKIKSLDSNAKCGTLICPLDYFSGHEFTMNWLSKNNKAFLDIENQEFAVENPLYKEFRGVISNIKEKNYNRLFAGRGYIKFTYTNGENNIIYSDFGEEKNARAVAEVAKKALEDTSANYTPEQISVLESFIK